MTKLEENIVKAVNLLCEHEIPINICFDIPGTKNIGAVGIINDLLNQNKFRFQVIAWREGSSLQTNYFLEGNMTEQEIKECIKNKNPAQIAKFIMELSEKVDDKEGEFPSDY